MTDDNGDDMWSRGRNKNSAALTISGRGGENTQALARAEAIGKIGAVVRAGAGVEADAQRLAVFLAGYGEGSRMGKYAFSGAELLGLSKEKTGTRTVARRGWGRDEKNEQVQVDTVEDVDVFDWVKTSDALVEMPGERLRDAVALLVARGWAETTHDGPYAGGCDFHEVKLTAAGRQALQGFVGRAQGGDGVASMPSLFDTGAAVPVARERTDLEVFSAMLGRAKVKSATEHLEHEGVSQVTVGDEAVFTFDGDGKLVGFGVGGSDVDGEG